MEAASASSSNVMHESAADAVYRKVTLRLIPFLLLCYVLSYLDRVNVGFAKLQMLSDLKLSEAVYGLGAGIFFIGYFMFEVPSNIILHKVGARRWIARIMISWGILSALTMFVSGEISFYVLRFLLGLAEAGFFPGIIFYLTKWYPAERRGRATSLFLAAIALAGVLGGPISGWILQGMSGVQGMAGWQWLFLLEGLPSVVVGIWLLFYLDDEIRHARWLTDGEKKLLLDVMAKDASGRSPQEASRAFLSGRTWLLAAIYFMLVFALYGISFWLPTIIKGAGVTDAVRIGFLSALPWAAGCCGMVLVARSSDRTGERRKHIALSAIAGAMGFVMSIQFSNDVQLSLVGLSIATFGTMAALPLFWSLPTAYLGGTAAAAGIALINSIGNLAGFFGPSVIGAIKASSKSTDTAIYLLAACLVAGAMLVMATPASDTSGSKD